MIRVELPAHLRTLAGLAPGKREVTLDTPAAEAVTTALILDRLESAYPVLAGTMRDHVTHKRRPFVRFFACGRDFSLQPPDQPLPAEVAEGREPFLVVGAIAGG